jgi:hypothetical protein
MAARIEIGALRPERLARTIKEFLTIRPGWEHYFVRRGVECREKLFVQTSFDPFSFARCDDVADNGFYRPPCCPLFCWPPPPGCPPCFSPSRCCRSRSCLSRSSFWWAPCCPGGLPLPGSLGFGCVFIITFRCLSSILRSFSQLR